MSANRPEFYHDGGRWAGPAASLLVKSTTNNTWQGLLRRPLAWYNQLNMDLISPSAKQMVHYRNACGKFESSELPVSGSCEPATAEDGCSRRTEEE
jgi:hypothetical protein